jgi:hypothetical protein
MCVLFIRTNTLSFTGTELLFGEKEFVRRYSGVVLNLVLDHAGYRFSLATGEAMSLSARLSNLLSFFFSCAS